ncbi:MAG: S1C family serine protease [Salinirussus sp.]
MSEEVSRRHFVSALGAAAAGGLAGCSIGGPREGDIPSTVADDAPTPTVSEPAQDDNAPTGSYPALYREVRDSVAAVRVDTPDGAASGTAWTYDGAYHVTNEHVVADGSDVALRFTDVGWRDAEIVGTDAYSDLAVLNVDGRPESATPLELVDRPAPVGTAVAAVGNPFGLSGSMSAGVISGRERTLPAPNGFSIPDAVQTDAALNPGNSGGPLMTLEGLVAGVVNAGGGDNIGFAISAAMVKRVIPALINDGTYEHAYMGVGIGPVTPPVIQANDLPVATGVYIARIVEGGPAEGVLQGASSRETVDGETVPVGGDVVVEMAGVPIRDEGDLSRTLALETRPGDTVEVVVYRDGTRTSVDLTLGSRPPP